MSKLDYNRVSQQLLSYPGSFLSQKETRVSLFCLQDPNQAQGLLFAVLQTRSLGLNLSLRCDPQLALVLRERYETVLPGYKLPQKYWNTLVLSQQLAWPDVVGLIDHSYNLALAKVEAKINEI